MATICRQLALLSAVLALAAIQSGLAGHAHSFAHFLGPVTGPGHEVAVHDKHGHQHVDYVAHPKYEFAYGIEDHHTGDYHGQKEHRDGKPDHHVYKIANGTTYAGTASKRNVMTINAILLVSQAQLQLIVSIILKLLCYAEIVNFFTLHLSIKRERVNIIVQRKYDYYILHDYYIFNSAAF